MNLAIHSQIVQSNYYLQYLSNFKYWQAVYVLYGGLYMQVISERSQSADKVLQETVLFHDSTHPSSIQFHKCRWHLNYLGSNILIKLLHDRVCFLKKNFKFLCSKLLLAYFILGWYGFHSYAAYVTKTMSLMPMVTCYFAIWYSHLLPVITIGP